MFALPVSLRRRVQPAIRSKGLVVAIALAYLLLAIGYSVTIPLWEADNEWSHYRYVRYIVTHHALPDPTTRKPTERPPKTARGEWPEREWHQFSQPPLYYLLAAIVILPVDISDNLWPVPNPYVHSSTGEGGINFAVHGPEEAFPYQGTNLAVHLIRWFSALLGLIALAGVYRLAQTILPGREDIALGTLALTAFSPQFLFAASTVNNDILIAATGAWTLVYGLRTIRHPERLAHWILAALWLSLAVLTKYNGLVLVPFTFVCFLIGLVRLARAQGFRRLGQAVLGSGLVFALIAGGWFLNNRIRYGRFITRYPYTVDRLLYDLRNLYSPDLSWLTAERLRRAAAYSFETYWASFGWANLGLPKFVYQVLAVFCLIAALGLILRMIRSTPENRAGYTWRVSLLLIGLIALAWTLGAYKALRNTDGYLHGRYLLPVLPVISFLIVWGISAWAPGRALRPTMVVLGGAFLFFAGWTMSGPLRQAYAPPPLLAQATPAPDEQLLEARFGDYAELVAYKLWPENVAPGQAVAVTLLWRALAPMDYNYTLGIHILGEDLVSYGERNLYPGRGNFATTLWRPGDIFRETYWVPLQDPPPGPVPTMGRISVALFRDTDEQQHLPVTDARGTPIGESVIFGRLRIAGDEPAAPPPTKPLGVLNDEIALVRAETAPDAFLMAGFSLPITLTWQALATPAADYTIFVQLLSEDGRWVAGQDAPPRHGNYPTGLWRAGDVVSHTVTLSLPKSLPSGTYRLITGMYRPEDMQRLPARDAAGTALPDDAITFRRLYIAGREHHIFVPSVHAPANQSTQP